MYFLHRKFVVRVKYVKTRDRPVNIIAATPIRQINAVLTHDRRGDKNA